MAWSLTRRAFITGGTASALLVGPLAAGGFAAAQLVYGLDPNWGATDPSCAGRSCAACNACENHAANKLFATEAAADAGRAHPGCRCLVVAVLTTDDATYGALFASGPAADRRHASVRAVLDRLEVGVPPPAAGVPMPGVSPPATVVGTGSAPAGRPPGGTLAFTGEGASVRPLVVTGVASVGLGLVLWRMRRMEEVATATAPGRARASIERRHRSVARAREALLGITDDE